jgi:hypothetical protein
MQAQVNGFDAAGGDDDIVWRELTAKIQSALRDLHAQFFQPRRQFVLVCFSPGLAGQICQDAIQPVSREQLQVWHRRAQLDQVRIKRVPENHHHQLVQAYVAWVRSWRGDLGFRQLVDLRGAHIISRLRSRFDHPPVSRTR